MMHAFEFVNLAKKDNNVDAEQVIRDVHAQKVILSPTPDKLYQLYKGWRIYIRTVKITQRIMQQGSSKRYLLKKQYRS